MILQGDYFIYGKGNDSLGGLYYSTAKIKTDGPTIGEIKTANSLCKENLGKNFVCW